MSTETSTATEATAARPQPGESVPDPAPAPSMVESVQRQADDLAADQLPSPEPIEPEEQA